MTIIPEPHRRRQLGDEGLIVLWRAGSEPGRRQGLACILSMCPNPGCACRLVYVDCFVIDESVTAVSCDEDGLHVAMQADGTPLRVILEEDLIAIVDPDSGETRPHPDLPDTSDAALADWLGSELDEELLEVLHRYRARATGRAPEQPRTDIDVASLEEFHLAGFDDLFAGVRPDDYLLAAKRYWTCIYLCPYADCDCHKVRVAFFPEDAKPESGDTVGSVLLELGDAEGFKIVEMTAECGAPDHVIRELWALFGRRHDVGAFLRRREAQAKVVGATLWQPVAKPVRAAQQPGRNDPCPCGSGTKFKRCCLGKDPSTTTR
ncbi:MAG: SEC-C metal-binding domain-containing protein [Kofleriaceae bacterium]